MCRNCWKQRGSPKIRNERIEKAVEAIAEVHKFHVTGGNLHIVIDDWNIEDRHVLFCDEAIYSPNYPFSEEQRTAESVCLAIFRSLSVKERASALALSEGYF